MWPMRRDEAFQGLVAEGCARLGSDIDEDSFLAGELQVVIDHHGDQPAEIDLRAPAETSPCPGRIAFEHGSSAGRL